MIKEKGGVVKYREIVKKYNDDTNLDWEKEPPNSPIGLLRRHGFIIVGRMLIDNRFYKVILIPNEILQTESLKIKRYRYRPIDKDVDNNNVT